MQEKIQEALKKVNNPRTHKDIVSEGMVQDIASDKGKFVLSIEALPDRKLQLAIEAQIRMQCVKAGIPVESIRIAWKEGGPKEPVQKSASAPGKKIPGVAKVIAIGSGKGGVGKSTVSVNLAVQLQKSGYKTGILDADIYGPSVGKLLGINGRINMEVKNDRITPLEAHGIKVMSFSFLVDEHQPVVWRGPMLGKALEQFLYDIEWGNLDYLIIDLPPGTGDTQLSLAQLVQTNGAIVVTTPQNVALLDAGRAISMFSQVNIPVIGVIENMSEFICPHCGKPSHIFSTGGGSRLAERITVPLLGRIPLTVELMESGEQGRPLVLADKDKTAGIETVKKAYENICRQFTEVLA